MRTPHPTPAERLLAVEAAYGRAMLRAHGIEQSLTTWLICAVCQRKQSANEQSETALIKRLTLGGLIKRFVVESSAPTVLSEELSVLLIVRNELAHRISEKFADAAKTENWEEHAVLDLLSVCDQLAKCRSALRPYMLQAREMSGLSEEQLLHIMAREFPGLRVDA